MTKPIPPDSGNTEPWWSEDAPENASLPEGFPERPDGKKVDSLRENLKNERASRQNTGQNSTTPKFGAKTGKQARDIGTYTLIPMMMLAGPVVGYGLGWFVEKNWGGAPWAGVICLLLGVVASFRQIFILLNKKTEADKKARKG